MQLIFVLKFISLMCSFQVESSLPTLIGCSRQDKTSSNHLEQCKNDFYRAVFTVRKINSRCNTSWELFYSPRNVTTMLKLQPISSLVDSMSKITVSELEPLQKITLGANIVGDGGEIFQSHAHYIADKYGEVDLDRDPSLGGSYSGVEPMGLL